VFDLCGSSAAINQSNPLYSMDTNRSLYSIGVAIVSICDAKSRFGRDRQI